MPHKKSDKPKGWVERYIKQKYTIMMLPDSHEKTLLQFKMPIGVVTIGAALIAALASGVGVLSYIQSHSQSMYGQVLEENVQLSNEMEELAVRLNAVGDVSAQLDLLLDEYTTLKATNIEQRNQIEQFSVMAEDTVKQVDELLTLQNDVRTQLGFDPIPSAGGPDPIAEVSQNVARPDVISEYFTSAKEMLEIQQAGWHELGTQVVYINSIPSRWPVESRNITSYYGNRDNPFGAAATENHPAIDVGCPSGTPIYAAGQGKVVEAGWESGYGYTVVIDHGYGYVSRYSHCTELFVTVGENVVPNQHIAAVGSTGRSTGPHLDFRILYNDAYIDPLSILRE